MSPQTSIASPAGPPRDLPAIPGVDIERVGDELRIHKRSRLDFGGAFLLFWLAGWSIGCAFLAREVIRKPELRTILFAVPFFSAWFLAAGLCVLATFSRTEIRIGPGGIRHRWRALVLLDDRTIPLDQIKSVEVSPDPEPNDEEKRVGTVMILTLGNHIVCGCGLPLDERLALADLIDEHVLSLSPRVRFVPPATECRPSDVPAAPPLPDDSTLRLARDPDAFRVWRHHDFSVGTILIATSIMGFWNGCVAICTFDAVKARQWNDLILMSFHILIGLFMLLGWLSLLVLPFCQRTWEFRPDIITERFRAFRRPIWGRQAFSQELTRIEVRPIFPRRSRQNPPQSDAQIEPPTDYSLALIDRDDRDILRIGGLAEGEALRLQTELGDFYGIPSNTRTAATASPNGEPLWDRWLDESAI